MTGRELIMLHEIMTEAHNEYTKMREFYEEKLEELPPDAATDDAKRYRKSARKNDDKAIICAGVLNTIEMMIVDLKL